MNKATNNEFARKLLDRNQVELGEEEERVLRGISAKQPVSQDVGEVADQDASAWDRLADRVAAVGGSWAFIFSFFGVLFTWMLLNANMFGPWKFAFDPYPYIFLNLMLSMLAAIQAPIILMSQNRQADRDRIAASSDYQVNLRAEIEIIHLHEKIDALRIEHLEVLAHQQAEMMTYLRTRLDALPATSSTPPAAGG